MVQYPTSKAALAKPDFDTDNAAEHGFVDFFRKMPARIPGTVRIFDRKDYYSAHGEDALFVADVVYHTKTVLKYWKARAGREGDLPSCTLSKAVAISFLREALTSRQMRVEIYKPASAGNSKRENWEIDAAASPGNLEDVEELLFGDNIQIADAPMCLAITFKVTEGIKTVGIAYADAVDRKIGVSEFVETDIWSNTESLLIQLGVKEVIYPVDDKSNEIEALKLRKLIDRCSIVHAERPKSSFGIKSIEQDLNGLIRGDVDLTARPEYDMKQALSACNGLITYLTLLTSDGNRKAYELKTHDLAQYMKLDASAVRALTLMPDLTSMNGPPVLSSGASSIVMGRAGKDSSSSLFGLLNKCQTGQGKRMLATWLKQPLVNLHQIENRQNLVEAFVEQNDVRQILREGLLKLMPDFQRLAKRYQNKKATLDDIVRAYSALIELPNVVEQLERVGTVSTGKDFKGQTLPRVANNPDRIALMDDLFLNKLRDDIANTAKFVELVETTMDVAQFKHNKTIILPDYDDTLKKLAMRIQKAKDALDSEYEQTTEELGFNGHKTNPLHFENHSTYGHCFRLTRKEASAIKGKKEYIELANKQNGCTFTTRKLKEANEEFQSASELYGRKQSHLAKEIIDIASTYSNTLEGINPTIAQLDVICSLAHVAVNAPISYVKPKVLEKGSGSLLLKESRHPCLETLPDINFIPNDVEMEREKSEFQIITGANTGGKSVYLRQIGCIALMAQVGSFVPASEAQIPIFDCILARVGAGDSQLKGISTFMAEMLETATILKSATKDSLIIIDELGRGTSTYDGFGLAWAISEHIAMQIRCFALFATHFHDLTTLSEQIPHVMNMHVMAHVEEKSDSITGRDIVMLYKVKPGISDQSFGIHVAELAKFPDEVVRLAKRKADELGEQLEDAENLPQTQRPKCSADEMANGTALVAEMLKDWAIRAEEDLPNIDETIKVCHSGANGTQDEAATAARAEKELDLLREVLSKYEGRMQANPYFANVLLETY